MTPKIKDKILKVQSFVIAALFASLLSLFAMATYSWLKVGTEEEVEKKAYALETTVDSCKGKEGSVGLKLVEEDGDVVLQEYECKNGIWELDERETARWRMATEPKTSEMYWSGDCLPEAEDCGEPEYDILTTDEETTYKINERFLGKINKDNSEPEITFSDSDSCADQELIRCEEFECLDTNWDVCWRCGAVQ